MHARRPNLISRVDSASRLIQASPTTVYRAFVEPLAMEQWLPPRNMLGKMLHFDFREGGANCMRLTYKESHGQGKTSDDADEVKVRLVKIEHAQRIEQAITFKSEDPAFAGVMRMIWTFQPEGRGTRVSNHAENVPEGIRPEDHAAGMHSTLEKLAEFVAARK